MKKVKLSQMTCLALSFIYFILYLISSESHFFIVMNVFLAALFIIEAKIADLNTQTNNTEG